MSNMANEVSLNYNSFYKYSALGAIASELLGKNPCIQTTIINVKFNNITL